MKRNAIIALLLGLLSLVGVSSASGYAAGTQVGGTTLGNTQAGLTGYYDYSPHGVIDMAAQTETDYWCGDSPAHIGDTIMEMRRHLYSWTVTVPETIAFDEGPAGSWDYQFTCNPSNAIKGTFSNVFGDGKTYNYVLYYTGQGDGVYDVNQIGAAFSVDGLKWRKYPKPVIAYPDSSCGCYGYGQPSASIANGSVELAYEESTATDSIHHLAASSDGVHFGAAQTITKAGLSSSTIFNGAPDFFWGAEAFNPTDGKWYALYNDGWRPSSTTAGIQENSDNGCTLFSTTDLLGGSWTELDTVDTNLTGSESNFMCGFATDTSGNIVQGLFGPNAIKMMVSTSYPIPAYNATQQQAAQTSAFNNWQINWQYWTPGSPLRPLVRLLDYPIVHEVTTGYYDSSKFKPEETLGSLYEAPHGAATRALYGCKLGYTDYFIAQSSDCYGQYKLGLEGYAYTTPASDRLPLYRCEIADVGDFVSSDPNCEGFATMELLGYSQL